LSRQLNIYSGTKRLDFVFDALPGTDATMDDRSLENARRPSGRSVRTHYRLPRALNLITACCQIFRHSWVAVRCSCGSRDAAGLTSAFEGHESGCILLYQLLNSLFPFYFTFLLTQ